MAERRFEPGEKAALIIVPAFFCAYAAVVILARVFAA